MAVYMILHIASDRLETPYKRLQLMYLLCELGKPLCDSGLPRADSGMTRMGNFPRGSEKCESRRPEWRPPRVKH